MKQNSVTGNFYSAIKNKLNNRDYRIGLDLGVGSIGFSIIATDSEGSPESVVHIGSRIFKSSAGAATRREKRGQRNAHRHKIERLRKLWRVLAASNLALPLPPELFKTGFKETSADGETSKKRFCESILRKDVYFLRKNALDVKLELQELGYVIYHLANHRGSSSVRTFLEDDEKTRNDAKKMQGKANRVHELMAQKSYRTYGELLWAERLECASRSKRPAVRNRDNKDEIIITRDVALAELNRILEQQKKFHPAVLTNEYCESIVNAFDFEYDKFVPEPGKCPYFENEKRLPKSHTLVEERRLWEALNNIRVSIPDLEGEKVVNFKPDMALSGDQKERLYKILRSGTDLNHALVCRELKLSRYTEVVLQGRTKDVRKIKGYAGTLLEQQDFWKRLTGAQQTQFFYDWNSISDDRQLRKVLKDKYALDSNEADFALREIELSSDYAPIGKTASQIILPDIKTGLSFFEAIENAYERGDITRKTNNQRDTLPYYGEILSDSTQPVIAKAFSQKYAGKNFKKPNTNPDEEHYGRIANPVVHQTLNELRKLVNEIIEASGRNPASVSVDVARELKLRMADR
ncbi:MAG: hypothetical protein PHW69_06675, partial [Elusimicrobiaceae bacterium]|nr:hypothetical protein [Elusimicrobiaceae bacterium]